MGNKPLISIALCLLVLGTSSWFGQGNTAPRIEILRPLENTKLRWNASIPYAIEIVDKEDGNSEYGEIPANEVILAVKYLPDSAKVGSYLVHHAKDNSDVLSWMGRSNCFSCHTAKDKLIGPSFEQIAHKYGQKRGAIEDLAKKIIHGSTGTWGDQIMPAQPDLDMARVEEVVTWILDKSAIPDFDYFSGTQGVFKTTKNQKEASGKAVYVLSAQYMDHGINGTFRDVKRTVESMVLASE